ncbi:MAG: hypothetical protein GQ564_04090 [Bacteroidales bacterium]|nr:hypothetical protein [Bacteroidales bacterium]
MKKKSIIKKLVLKKGIISNLNMSKLNGGGAGRTYDYYCDTEMDCISVINCNTLKDYTCLTC